jgi:hypothetical protein
MNLCVDQGNTLLKAAVFLIMKCSSDILHLTVIMRPVCCRFSITFQVEKAILSSVSAVSVDTILSQKVKRLHTFDHHTPCSCG